MLSAALSGFFSSLGLIVAIGAQNAFVLRQGIKREYVKSVVMICALSDATLISIGVGGFATLGPALPWINNLARLAGAGFLFIYGALRFYSAWRSSKILLPAQASHTSRASVIFTCLLITWANPHVYLDTVVLLGSISMQHHPNELLFGFGAVMASILFFASLGFGARLLAPVFSNPRAWVILEIMVGAILWSIALTLLVEDF